MAVVATHIQLTVMFGCDQVLLGELVVGAIWVVLDGVLGATAGVWGIFCSAISH